MRGPVLLGVVVAIVSACAGPSGDAVPAGVEADETGKRGAGEHFLERGAGHVINVSSMLGRIPFAPIRSAYSASKHALNGPPPRSPRSSSTSSSTRRRTCTRGPARAR